MNIPSDLKFTKEHEWLKMDGSIATFGISDYAQEALGDIVFVELPDIGQVLKADEPCAVVESVKAVSDVYAPASGEILEVNETLNESPELVNSDPYGEGWIAKIRLAENADLSALMNADAYASYLLEE